MSANPNVRTTRCVGCGSMECGISCRLIDSLEGPDYGKDDEYHEPARTGWGFTEDQRLDDQHRGSV